MAKIGLSSPWVEHYRKLAALFKNDKDVHVVFDEDARTVKLFVDNAKKAAALTAIIPAKKRFGKVELKIAVIPADEDAIEALEECDVLDAFINNAAVSFIRKMTGTYAPEFIYVVFKKEVVQYFTDDLSDYYGIHSTLYEDIARDIFVNVGSICFSTDANDSAKVGKPLGEWP